MNSDINVKLGGQYKLVVSRNGEVTKDSGWMDNLILNNGLNLIETAPGGAFVHMSLGTGTTEPANNQTALISPVASYYASVVTAESSGSPAYTGSLTLRSVFPQGSVVGIIGEIGIGPVENGINLFSRSLIKDSSGNSTTITVTALDQITVYYKLSSTPPLTSSTGSVVISGVTYGYTIRVAGISSYFVGSNLGPGRFRLSRSPSFYAAGCSFPTDRTDYAMTGTNIDAPLQSTITYDEYVVGSYAIGSNITVPVESGNHASGIQGMSIGHDPSGVYYQVLFSAPIPKTNTTVLTLMFRTSWSRG